MFSHLSWCHVKTVRMGMSMRHVQYVLNHQQGTNIRNTRTNDPTNQNFCCCSPSGPVLYLLNTFEYSVVLSYLHSFTHSCTALIPSFLHSFLPAFGLSPVPFLTFIYFRLPVISLLFHFFVSVDITYHFIA